MDVEKVKKLCKELEELRQQKFRMQERHELNWKDWNIKYNRSMNELKRECESD